MNNYKKYLIFFALAFFAGVFLSLYCGCNEVLCEASTIVGNEPDNHAYIAAFGQVKKAAVEPWNINADVVYNGKKANYNLKNASINLTDTDSRMIFCGKKSKAELYRKLIALNLPKAAVFEYIFPLFNELVNNFHDVEIEKIDASVTFDKNGFHYTEGRDGVHVDTEKLFESLLENVGEKVTINLPLSYDKAVTVNELRKNTVKKASFTTFFANSGKNRCHNIALATESLNGTTVHAGEFFGFNSVVGERTEQNGYKTAKVISDGVYADGTGGGVCQVSTTLYNALLLSEVIPRAYQHSLVSSYVLAGFDAMVSDYGADLSFVNNGNCALYIEGKTDLNRKCVTFTVYGAPNTFDIKRENEEERVAFETVEIVDRQKYPELIYTDQTKNIVSGSDGVKTKSYLCYYKNGELVEKKLIRQNSYKKVDAVIARGYLERPENE